MIKKFVLPSLLAALSLCGIAEGQAIRLMPTGPRGEYLYVMDFNNLGQVVGFYTKAFRQGDAPYMWDGAFHALPDLGGGGGAFGINDAGVIVGYADLADDYQAVRFTEDTVVQFGPGYLTDVNNSGEATDNVGRRTVNVYTGLSTQIGAGLIGILRPNFINDSGHVAGSYYAWSGNRAFVDFGGGGIDLGDLPVPGESYDVFALGPNGEIAGSAYVPVPRGENPHQAFTWDSTNGMQPLPVGQTIRGFNNLGDAVGTAIDAVTGRGYGAYWHDGQLINVNDLLEGTGWTVDVCLKINDVGQIVAEGNPMTGQRGTIIIDLDLLGGGEPVAPTITISGGPFVYDGAPHAAIVSVIGADDEVLTPTSVSYEPGGSNPPVNAGSYVITVTFEATAEHAEATATGTVVIERASPTINVEAAPFVYDGSPHEAQVTVTGANGEVLSPTSATYAPGGSNPPIDAGSYEVSVAFDASANYEAAAKTGTIVISPAPVLIAPTNLSKALNAPNPPLVGSLAGLLTNDNIAVTYSTSATLTSPVGSYPITASLADPDGRLSNYEVTIESATLSIVFAGNSGVLNPVNADDSSVFKQGSTVPVKIQVFDANGISVGATGTIVDFRIVAIIAGTASETVNEVVASTTPDSAFRWTGSQWMFNVSTKSLLANRTYRFRITFADGNSTEFAFGLK